MNFLFFGAGALGQALGCMLVSKGHQVDLVVRPRFVEQITGHGLRVGGLYGDFVAEVGEGFSLLTDISQASRCYDYALITTKTYDTAEAIAAIAALKTPARHIVSMQNGCGNLEQVETSFGPGTSLGARVITGFEIQHPGKIKITVSADDIHIGGSQRGDNPAANTLATAIREAGHPCRAVEDIHQSLFAKLLYNCALNPLGALLGVHYGALGEQVESRRLMEAVIDETFQTIVALGGKTPWESAEAYKKVFYSSLLPATYNHRASMLQDLENQKPTEVDALVGYVAKEGKEKGIATPTCEVLTAMVKFREKQGARD